MHTILKNSHLTAVISSLGAELVSLKEETTGREYIWEGNPAIWGKHAPVLFPIVGTLKDNYYYHNQKRYELPRHGFARDMEFKRTSLEDSSCEFSLLPDKNTREKYPFDFELIIGYKLSLNSLEVEYQIVNHSEETMPFSIGGHPAFALPKPFPSYQLEFEVNESLQCFSLENDLLSDRFEVIELRNRILNLDYTTFEKDALILKRIESNSISLLEENKPILHFHFEDFKNFGIWTKPNAPFICLEPWNGYSDLVSANGQLNQKEGIQFIYAGEAVHYCYSIEIV